MKNTQQVFLGGILYAALFLMIACKKDNPAPTVDVRTKFVGTWNGLSTTTSLCTYDNSTTNKIDSSKLFQISLTDSNRLLIGGLIYYLSDSNSIMQFGPHSYGYNWPPDYYIKGVTIDGILTLKDGVLTGSSHTTEITTATSGVNYTCSGFQTWHLKKQ